MTASQGQPPFQKNQTLGLMKNAGKPWRLRETWTRDPEKVENSEGKLDLLSEGHRLRLVDPSVRRSSSHGQSMSQSCQQILPLSMFGIVWKISGKNVCPPKLYVNGKNGTAITNPKDDANEHAAAFRDNSSSAHYSATFQAIKEQEETVKIDFTSDNTEVYNKPFRLRDLRWSIIKAKPHAPGPDGIHNYLLKHLPEDTLKIIKGILNKIRISAYFPHQWRAASVIPVPKPSKDHTDPLSYRPIALTRCLCKVLERMIYTHFIWYLEKSGIFRQKRVWLQETS